MGVAAVMSGGVKLASDVREEHLQRLISACNADISASVNNASAEKRPNAFDDFEDLVPKESRMAVGHVLWDDCNPSVLRDSSESKLTTQQREILLSDAATFSPAPWFLGAVGLLVLSALPWLWYSFLRRIAELKSAVGGNPPER